jgi:anti-sigma factor RsiW
MHRRPQPAEAMNCTEFLHRYSDYDDSLLDVTELESFRAHLTACASCARYDRVLRKGRMLARQHAQATPGEDFIPRLQDRLWQHRIERRRRLAQSVPGGAAAALAAVTVVLSSLGVVALMDAAGESPGSPGAAATAGANVPEAAVRVADPGSGGWGPVPVVEAPAPRDWGARRVDQRVPVAYSPLVTGPPAYRVQHAFQASATMSPGRTLD